MHQSNRGTAGNRRRQELSSLWLFTSSPLPRLQVGETYNIGTQKERSVVDVARDICKLFNRDPDATIKHVRDRAFNDRRYFMWVTRGGAVCRLRHEGVQVASGAHALAAEAFPAAAVPSLLQL